MCSRGQGKYGMHTVESGQLLLVLGTEMQSTKKVKNTKYKESTIRQEVSSERTEESFSGSCDGDEDSGNSCDATPSSPPGSR